MKEDDYEQVDYAINLLHLEDIRQRDLKHYLVDNDNVHILQ